MPCIYRCENTHRVPMCPTTSRQHLSPSQFGISCSQTAEPNSNECVCRFSRVRSQLWVCGIRCTMHLIWTGKWICYWISQRRAEISVRLILFWRISYLSLTAHRSDFSIANERKSEKSFPFRAVLKEWIVFAWDFNYRPEASQSYETRPMLCSTDWDTKQIPTPTRSYLRCKPVKKFGNWERGTDFHVFLWNLAAIHPYYLKRISKTAIGLIYGLIYFSLKIARLLLNSELHRLFLGNQLRHFFPAPQVFE
jgi:hypothetical protein